MHALGRRMAAAVAATALVGSASALFGGVAFAGGPEAQGGNGGGTGDNLCVLPIAIPQLSALISIPIQNKSAVSQCNVTTGNGGDAVEN